MLLIIKASGTIYKGFLKSQGAILNQFSRPKVPKDALMNQIIMNINFIYNILNSFWLIDYLTQISK